MTVQSIDKRVVPEANMTSVSQDKQQTGTSAEDAFLSVLQQTTQRYSGKTGKLGGLLSGDKVLSEHITRLRTEVKVDARQDTRDSAPQPAAKDAKPAAKGDKTRAAAPAPAAPRKSDDDQAAPAKVKADDDTSAAQSSQAQAADDDTRSRSGDDGAPAPAEAKGQDKQEMVVAVEVTITETVQVVQVDNSAPMTRDDLKSLAAAISNQLGAKQDGDDGQDPLAGLSAADRQRISDLENQLVNDADQGNFEDALDDATQLVQQIITKVGEHKAAAQATGADDKTGLADDQARDLAAMLSGSGVHLDVKVQTRGADTAPAVQATTLVDAMSLTEPAAGQGAAPQPGGQDPQAGQGFAAGKDTAAAEPVAVAPAQDAAQGQTIETEAHPFAAVLAAQMEASTADDAAAPQQHGIAGLASVGGAQAADKASAGQAAQSAARTPRTLLQAQVMEQVTVQIDKQVKDGADTIKIQLKPYELGKIEVKLEVSSDGRVSATVTADKPETLAMLQKDAKGLEKALEDAGLKPDTSATTFSLKGGEQQQNADRGNNNGRSRRGRSRGGEAGADAASAASGIAQAGRGRTLGGRSGVDISV
jgi:hypothetical protein